MSSLQSFNTPEIDREREKGMELLLETQMEDRRPLLPKLLFAIAVHLASYFIHQLDFSSYYANPGLRSCLLLLAHFNRIRS